MLYNKRFINLACKLGMYREISDLDLFVQTSPYGLGLYKNNSARYFSVQTSRSVNKKLICICMCFCNFYRIYVSWRLEVDQRTNTSVLVGRCVGFLRFRRIGSFFIQQRKNILTIFFYMWIVDYEYTLISSRLIIDTNINWMTKRINFTALRPILVIIVKSTITYKKYNSIRRIKYLVVHGALFFHCFDLKFVSALSVKFTVSLFPYRYHFIQQRIVINNIINNIISNRMQHGSRHMVVRMFG